MSRIVHERMTDELLDMLVLHAMELLPERDAAELEEHLAEGCEVCNQQLDAFRETAARIARSVPLFHPPDRLRQRLLAEITQVWKTWAPEEAGDALVVRASEGDWQEVHTGVWAKRLYVNVERDTVTMLIRMSPGASYLPHRHGGPEQCYVLDGDLREGELTVRAGDFQCASEGTSHGVQSTDSGCLLLIVSSLKDELL